MYLVETPFYGIANFHLDGNIAFVGFGAEKPPEEKALQKDEHLFDNGQTLDMYLWLY